MEQHVTTFSRILTFDTESDYFSVLLDFLYFLPPEMRFFFCPHLPKSQISLVFRIKKVGRSPRKNRFPPYIMHILSACDRNGRYYIINTATKAKIA